ncbi:MAG TPA: hypothetical protein PLX89_01595 [Verrucomicrobiota bacterium]|nr:hypothetical protein [Verrucomicrobiales bacterium]HRI11671.1 hypothetical protein [Verrucomicrobiota bacterium]
MADTAHQPESSIRPHTGAQFAPTQWSLVLVARDAGHSGQREALERLANAYLPPIYGFLRRALGLPPQDAEDLGQEFLAGLLATPETKLAKLAAEHGRFRDFLKAGTRNFTLNWLRDRKVPKRGGGKEIVSLEAIVEAGGDALVPQVPAEAEAWFDREWAASAVAQARARLEDEFRRGGQLTEFTALSRWLTAEPPDGAHADLARQLGFTEQNSRKKLQRLRETFAVELRRLVRETLSDPADLDAELNHLATAYARVIGQ